MTIPDATITDASLIAHLDFEPEEHEACQILPIGVCSNAAEWYMVAETRCEHDGQDCKVCDAHKRSIESLWACGYGYLICTDLNCDAPVERFTCRPLR